MVNAVGYIRVSTKRQGRSGLGLEAQEAAIRQFAASDNLTIVEWRQHIESGTNSDRPALLKALVDCNN